VLRRFALFPLLALLFLAFQPAGAQTSRGDVSMRLTSFSPWTAPDRPLALGLEVRNGGSTPVERLSVRLTIRDRARSRSALRSSLDGSSSGEDLAVTTEDLDRPLAAGETAQITISRDLASLAAAFRSERAQSGVYPVSIQLRTGQRSLVERAGAFVFLASEPQSRINLVWILPLHRSPAYDPEGTYDRAQLAAELAPGGRLTGLAEMLEAHPAVPLTLAPTGLLPDQLRDLSDGFEGRGRNQPSAVPDTDVVARDAGRLLERLRLALASPAYELATATYGRADLATLVAANLTLDAGQQVKIGASRVAELLGRQPNPALLASGSYRVDSGSARAVAALGARTLILDPSVLRDRPGGPFGPERPEEVTAPGLSFGAMLVDQSVRQRLGSPGEDPVLAAQGVLAETAAAYFERPALADGRLLVVATDGSPSPAVARPLLDALAFAPWARIRTASDAIADPELAPESEPRRLGAIRRTEEERLVQAASARVAIDTLGDIVLSPPGATAALEGLLLASESADFTSRPAGGSALARAARGRAERQLSQIGVASRRVTLTARGGQVPVTIVNNTVTEAGERYALRLRVRLDSPKVRFPDGAVQTVEIRGRVQTITFALQARAAGSFPISVVLETPGGERAIGTGQVLVRSTAVSAVTLMATAGGAIFLLGAWARRAWARRAKPPASP
jgi:hypothetical protein